jgi:polar amino acid transport system substrate-binding protein
MKKLIKMFMLLVCIACTATLYSCAEDEEYEGTLVVATNCEFPPFEYVDTTGNYIGIDMELAAEIAKILNYKLEIKDMAFDSVLAALEAKQANIAMAGLTISEERKTKVDFCTPYFTANQVIIGKADSAAVTAATYEEAIAALEGKKIGFQAGTVGQYFVEGDEDWEFDGISGATAMSFTSGAAAILALNNGQIDYVVIDKVPALQFVSKNTNLAVNLNVNLTEEEYAFAVQKGDEELLEKINAALQTLIENGKFDEIVSKYYSE